MYDRDYVTLPAVDIGDTVRVTYRSKQNDSEQTREGEVVELHANGFTFDHGDDGYATGVRSHDHGYGESVNVSTLRAKDTGDGYIHSTHLNGKASREYVTVEVVE